jgi:hypothetical protein
MLNIAEPIPLLESVPPISETQSSSNIRDLIDTDRVLPISGIPGIEFRRNYLEFRNLTELLRISINSGIGRSSWNFRIGRDSWEVPRILNNFVFTQFSEFRTGIIYLFQRLNFNHNSMREVGDEK